jgi:hypothetical protein
MCHSVDLSAVLGALERKGGSGSTFGRRCERPRKRFGYDPREGTSLRADIALSSTSP